MPLFDLVSRVVSEAATFDEDRDNASKQSCFKKIRNALAAAASSSASARNPIAEARNQLERRGLHVFVSSSRG